MSNRLFLPLLILIALIAAACGGATTETAEPANAADAADAPDTTTAAPEPETTTTAAPEPETTTAAPEPEPEEAQDGAATDPADDLTDEPITATGVDGMEIYEANCARCHVSDGTGRIGPSLLGIAERDPDQSRSLGLVMNGGGRMPSFGSDLSPEEIQAVVDYAHDTFLDPAS